MPITALFAGLLAPLYIVLALRVIGSRRSARVALGDGGDPALTRRMRVHANFAEYAPFTLLLMGLAESLQASQSTLYVAGACLVAGRLLHALGVSQVNEIILIRTVGITLTISAIVIAALACIRLGFAVHT
jgi:uncharacterized membrane protein YecN with MAPEG domain